MNQYHKLYTPQDTAIVFIDHQPQMLFGVANADRATLINNVTMQRATNTAAAMRCNNSSPLPKPRATATLPSSAWDATALRFEEVDLASERARGFGCSVGSLIVPRSRTASRSRSRPTASLAAIKASMLKIREAPWDK